MLVVGIGGSTRPGSGTEVALQHALSAARAQGADTLLFGSHDLLLPMYDPAQQPPADRAAGLLEAVRAASGIILASPGYHGTVSGKVKNALDYLEELREDPAPYLTGRAVGCIAVAGGWQTAVGTLTTLRQVVHTLRGWPIPYGASINSSDAVFADGELIDPRTRDNLALVGEQVVELARRSHVSSASA